ncbi:hypothetical protein [Rossellomorea sp. KS-H15a]|uniref:hypothetical protein n=1 Tax=Rossellomorea sp. KS-H15a TaxID=2963940 RepID=UPI0020C6B0BB|nr:hypothetical protein [Rossellomorea sp. KS-H15a]UTE78473.1 hypothetical protein M1J35_06820 [Rossellomorea sp. KS-H15a]
MKALLCLLFIWLVLGGCQNAVENNKGEEKITGATGSSEESQKGEVAVDEVSAEEEVEEDELTEAMEVVLKIPKYGNESFYLGSPEDIGYKYSIISVHDKELYVIWPEEDTSTGEITLYGSFVKDNMWKGKNLDLDFQGIIDNMPAEYNISKSDFKSARTDFVLMGNQLYASVSSKEQHLLIRMAVNSEGFLEHLVVLDSFPDHAKLIGLYAGAEQGVLMNAIGDEGDINAMYLNNGTKVNVLDHHKVITEGWYDSVGSPTAYADLEEGYLYVPSLNPSNRNISRLRQLQYETGELTFENGDDKLFGEERVDRVLKGSKDYVWMMMFEQNNSDTTYEPYLTLYDGETDLGTVYIPMRFWPQGPAPFLHHRKDGNVEIYMVYEYERQVMLQAVLVQSPYGERLK